MREMRCHGDFARHRRDGGPIAAMSTLAVGIVTSTDGGNELLIRTYYPNIKDSIYRQLYNHVAIHVIFTLL